MKKIMALLLVCLLAVGVLPAQAAQLSPAQWVTETDADASGVYLSSDAHSGSYSLAQAGKGSYSYATWQEVSVPNGTYTLTGYTRSSGGQSGCWLAVSQYGGEELRGNITPSDSWQQVKIENIQVSAGKAVITIWSNASMQAWALADDLQLVNDKGEDLLENGDFETVGAVNKVEENAPGSTPGAEAVTNVASKFFSKWTIYASPSADVAYMVPGGHSGEYCGVHYFATTGYTSSTCQLLAGLPDGSYGVTAWVRSSGGQKAAQLVVKAGGRNYVANIPATDAWTQVCVSDVPVSEGTLEVSIWTEADAGQWVMYDDLAAFRMEKPDENLLSNPGFEMLGASPVDENGNAGAEGAGGDEQVSQQQTIPQLEMNEEEENEDVAAPGKKLNIDWLLVGSIAIIALCTAFSVTNTVLLLKKGKKE